MAMNVSKVITALRDCPCRVFSGAGLRSLKGAGSLIERIVQSALWKLYPPEDPQSDDEEAWRHFNSERSGSKARAARGNTLNRPC